MQRGNEPGTAISWPHNSGTSSQPSLAGSEGGEFGVQIGRGAENGAGHVLAVDAVAADHQRHELPGRGQDFLPRVCSRPSSPRELHGKLTSPPLSRKDEQLPPATRTYSIVTSCA